jgi:outer membrane murein-binding lipoprotein Lpp
MSDQTIDGSVNVSTARVNELFQGKASSTIRDLMVENAQLQAVVEVLSTELQGARQQLAQYEARARHQAGVSSPDPAPPQDTVP